MSADHDLALLTPVLELAVVVAQTGERAIPPLASPPGLRPFLNFTRRVPPPALRAAKRVLDDNDEYRARVALVATDELVGRAGMLFVTRPEGWEEALAALNGDSEDAEVDDRDVVRRSGNERQLERRLRGAEESARRAEAALAKAEEAAVRARADLAAAHAQVREERSARREADEARSRAQAEVTVLHAGRESLRRELDAAKAVIGDLRRECAALDAELQSMHEERARRVALDEAIAQAVGAAEAIRAAVADLDGTSAPVGFTAKENGTTAGRRRVVPVGPDALRTPGPTRPTPSRAERARSAVEQRNAGRRVPITLPLAVLEESPEAAMILIRTPNAVVLVDGYNVSKLRWGDRSPTEQRQRLVDTLGELEARTGAEIHVVFDGAETIGPPPVPAVGRRPVRVSFSPPDVEADDVLIDLAATLPLHRPVVVVSGDRRVQDGVRRAGANVISSAQLIAALGMSPGGAVAAYR